MKPNTRILDYTALVQDGILTLDDVPQDITKEVTKWVRYLSGVTDNGMVKDDTPAPTPTPVAPVQKTTSDKPLLPKVGD
ncbi:MAG: hypothetical protein ACTHV0_00125 [Lactobacillus helveticus]|uniref:hypothetical protein n=1 Tax=Lactobacillus helveticus TaxID=1587 RepID=UPI000358480B|nr:hypothetical protein [Lactobacillus helveticus]AGQ23673.1 hypothetical protein lhe_1189 [Lactobacillus helveticus CNRZ32]KXN77088.1 hypothetical protein AY471_03300 [Lactobacillus helveticus]MBW7999331.1 hypothetical protein [Lactobacillus helveticus]MBW8063249.1 hypothetical protein [Lactobacillus helveticus]MCT3406227.1 hypothetical protein [Lactobacillus helveticus]